MKLYAILSNGSFVATHEDVQILLDYMDRMDLCDGTVVKVKKSFYKENQSLLDDLYLIPVEDHYTQQHYISEEQILGTDTWEYCNSITLLEKLLRQGQLEKKEEKHVRAVIGLLHEQIKTIHSQSIPLQTLRAMEQQLDDMEYRYHKDD